MRARVIVAITMRDHDAGSVICPRRQGRNVRPLLGAFLSKASRKS